MSKIRVLLYITPKFKWKYIVNWLITIWTMSWYSHTEIWTPDEQGYFDYEAVRRRYSDDEYEVVDTGFLGTCWTATMRGKANGTVKRDASGVLKHPEHWDYIEIEVTDKQQEILVWWLDKKVKANKGYAKRDLLKFVSPVHFPDQIRDICSELGNNALVVILVLLGFGIISPKKLAKKLIKLGHEIKPLKG